ncbi:polyprenyl synthetase family protein [Desulfosporosinus sp. BICA1-9]|uniref:polyprenyl synthetase family protein n=1 Tax=Desulfosporosinus sp. BICA1-9 TaxID=1531958 RepID=UPI00054B39A3|nr:polyprenyl synthetase family protein [Desulfosporosinus sp. BICA1-9]KJS46054.1 MAG: heptaprenyl diphosphate synthase [Peptococcaceae bacterium BRH_c23]KJS80520.1 MAG: heptaprenyl diphosphate synthase [Desulfosporosinus sp. BICA1-9]HBW34542.1 heptaprenyl diphosphate synthase [Desulfosporosinus sp.]
MKQLWLFNQINSDLQRVEKELTKFVETDFPILQDSAVHLLSAGGKRLRPAFTLLAGKFYGYSLEKLMPVAMALELIHMSSLVHDDIVDASMTRRGRPTVKAKWGNIVSIETGDYLFAKSLVLISKIDHPEVARILAEISVEMCQGEIQQIKSSFDVEQNLKQYYYRIKRKTALLISACCKLGALVSGAPRRQVWALGAYGHSLGMAFQIVDDVLDITAKPSEFGKPIGGDLRQGIMTLPMILALKLTSEPARLKVLLGQIDKTEEEVAETIGLIKATKAIDESMRLVDLYVQKAKRHLQDLPVIPTRKALGELAEFIRVRKF